MTRHLEAAAPAATPFAEEARIASGRQLDLLSRVSSRLASMRRTKLHKMANDRPIVSFTFDDVADSAAATGASVLEEHGARGTFYVAGNLCAKRFGPWRFADRCEVLALVDAGHEIGCHTFSHADIHTLRPREIAAEIEENREFLQGLDPRITLENFAYPYGSVGLPQKPVVQARFRSCRGVRPGINASRVDLGQILAVRLYDHELGPEEVDHLVSRTVACGGWLVFYTHDVIDPPTDQGSSPGLLGHALRSARRQGCEVLTVAQALSRMGVPHG